MNWNQWIRQTHRWLSMAFTLTVVANFVAMAKGPPPAWITCSPLLPLFSLMFSGLYMFFAPHAARWRRAGNEVQLHDRGDSISEACDRTGPPSAAAVTDVAQLFLGDAVCTDDGSSCMK